MRSTQFEDHSRLEDGYEEYRGPNQADTLCETIKRLGYAQNNQVRLYGKVFDLVSDPVSAAKTWYLSMRWTSNQVKSGAFAFQRPSCRWQE